MTFPHGMHLGRSARSDEWVTGIRGRISTSPGRLTIAALIGGRSSSESSACRRAYPEHVISKPINKLGPGIAGRRVQQAIPIIELYTAQT